MSKIKIDKKIVGYAVKQPEEAGKDQPRQEFRRETTDGGAEIIRMHEKLERPEMLVGSTYKVKTPVSDHAMYVTINDIVLNEGTEHEQRRPFEIFINSKNLDHYQWIVALTRIMSAVFRKGGDVTFLVEELRSVFDPQGGYFKRGGKYTPSLVAEIGDAIDSHMRMIGMIRDEGLDEHQQKLIDQKRREFEDHSQSATAAPDAGDLGDAGEDAPAFPPEARLCLKCQTKAVVMLDGCMTCLNCGDSKCG